VSGDSGAEGIPFAIYSGEVVFDADSPTIVFPPEIEELLAMVEFRLTELAGLVERLRQLAVERDLEELILAELSRRTEEAVLLVQEDIT